MSIFWAVAGVGILGGLALSFLRRRGGEVDRSQFEHSIRWFAQTKKDGGGLTFMHASTGLGVCLVRQNEVGDGCEILVQLVGPKWSERHDDLKLELDLHLFEPINEFQDGTNAPEWKVALPNVNAPDAGARVARALVLIFEVCGIGSGERFRVTSTGENSIRLWRPAGERWVEDENPLLRNIGRSTLRRLEEEKKSRNRSDGDE
jgi:hypothetical protein